MNVELTACRDSYYDYWFGLNALYEKWARRHGLTGNALFTLHAIATCPGECTQRLICEKLMLPKQTVNTILDAFEKKGYLLREHSSADRRSKLILLTEEGRRFAQELLFELACFEETALGNMSAKQRAGMLENSSVFLHQLRSALEAE